MRNVFILGCCIMSLTLSSCLKDNSPRPYYPQEYFFVDEFDNDANRWSFADPSNQAYGVVSNGTFKFDYNDDLYSAYYVSRDIGFNTTNDFTIYTRIGSNNNMGLLFGYNESRGSYGYSFMVDYDGYYALYDEGGNGYGSEVMEIVPPQTNRYVNIDGDWNDLILEQRGNRWIGYINEVEVFNVPAYRMYGKSIGFVNMPRTQGEVDYIQVDWLD